MTNELKPCAWCGSPAARGTGADAMFVFCSSDSLCPGTTVSCGPESWNRRAPSEAVGLLRALMDRLDSHFGGPSNDWKEQEQARRFLAAQERV